MTVEYPFLEVTKPNGDRYKIALDKIIAAQNPEEIYIAIGRQANNHIALSDPQKKISRHHCSLQYKNNRWWIVDKGSANGTFLQREIERPEIDVRSEDKIALGKHSLVLEPPEIHPICPAKTLKAQLVTIKGFQEPKPFIGAVQYHLQKLGIENYETYVPINTVGEPERKIIKVHQHKVVGFGVVVTGLNALDSISLQINGCGGKAKMGCGFFSPVSNPDLQKNEGDEEQESSNA